MCTVITPSSEGAETAPKALRVQSTTLAIFGAGGDLTKRLVVPALYHLVQAGRLPEQFTVIGVDRHNQTTEQWRQSLTEMLQAFTLTAESDARAWSWLTERMHYMTGDFTQSETFSHLEELLTEQREQNKTTNVLFYLAVGERFFGPIIEHLGPPGLTRKSVGAWPRGGSEKN